MLLVAWRGRFGNEEMKEAVRAFRSPWRISTTLSAKTRTRAQGNVQQLLETRFLSGYERLCIYTVYFASILTLLVSNIRGR